MTQKYDENNILRPIPRNLDPTLIATTLNAITFKAKQINEFIQKDISISSFTTLRDPHARML